MTGYMVVHLLQDYKKMILTFCVEGDTEWKRLEVYGENGFCFGPFECEENLNVENLYVDSQ